MLGASTQIRSFCFKFPNTNQVEGQNQDVWAWPVIPAPSSLPSMSGQVATTAPVAKKGEQVLLSSRSRDCRTTLCTPAVRAFWSLPPTQAQTQSRFMSVSKTASPVTRIPSLMQTVLANCGFSGLLHKSKIASLMLKMTFTPQHPRGSGHVLQFISQTPILLWRLIDCDVWCCCCTFLHWLWSQFRPTSRYISVAAAALILFHLILLFGAPKASAGFVQLKEKHASFSKCVESGQFFNPEAQWSLLLASLATESCRLFHS